MTKLTHHFTGATPPVDSMMEVCVELVFGDAEYSALEHLDQLSAFRSACLRQVIQVTSVSEERIHNVLMYDGSVHFQFDLLPPLMLDVDAPTQGRYRQT